MQNAITVTLDFPEEMLLRLGRAADAVGLTASSYVHASVEAMLEGRAGAPATRAETVDLAIRQAGSWLELQRRLRRAGVVLRLAGDGQLMLHDWPRNRPILPLAGLGHSLASLVLAFGAPFPTDVAPASGASVATGVSMKNGLSVRAA
ncbi:MAG: hypothetical protein H6895_04320 [Defluviimonas sp.]|uniref:hypothetical protein n=1 Tax=Albidovulum sp. TaxID=1872424 RepID=UPI001DAFF3C5|nr:hypothetical protein [Paracoccaceae bacterium]MCC0063299.1 hypothetical protein [Defluviimonas sp.]